MALPLDLLRIFCTRLPFTRLERQPVKILQAWLQICQPELFHTIRVNNKVLQPLELCHKVAAWAGYFSASNALYLPAYVMLARTVQKGDYNLFDDLMSRCYYHENILRLVLRQFGRQPTAEKILARLLANLKTFHEECGLMVVQLVDDIMLGKIVLTKRLLTMLLTVPRSTWGSNDKYLFWLGALTALKAEPFQAGHRYDYQLGYLAAGGKCSEVGAALYNLPVLVPETVALHELAPWSIEQLPRDGQRIFPRCLWSAEALYDTSMHYREEWGHTRLSVTICNRSLAILRQRAAILLALVPTIYAASEARAIYLNLLHVIVTGTVLDEDHIIPVELRFACGLVKILEELPRTTAPAFLDYELEDPVKWLTQLDRVDGMTTDLLEHLLDMAILQDCLPAVAQVLFQRHADWLRRYDDAPEYLEFLLAILKKREKQKISVGNSLLLSCFLSHLKLVGLRLGEFDDSDVLAALVLQLGAVQIEHQVTAYEYRFWQSHGLALLPLVNSDQIANEVQKLCSLPE